MPENAQKQELLDKMLENTYKSRGGVVSKMLENIENQEGRKYRIVKRGSR